MSRTGGLGAPRGQAFWPVRGPTLHRYGEQLQGELRWKGMVIGLALKVLKLKRLPTAG